MSTVLRLVNTAARHVSSLFPGYHPNAKHDHYIDYGYPTKVTFDLLKHMYLRNAVAKGAVNKTVDKVWQDTPRFAEDEVPHAETPLERDIRRHLSSTRSWQMLKASNARALVGGWSATVLLFEDGKPLDTPVSPMFGADVTMLAGMLPLWANQLSVLEVNTDEMSPDYGKPLMYSMTESGAAHYTQHQPSGSHRHRRVHIHPDRVLIWSSDGLPYGTSMLEAAYNDLLDIEKINGAGGEGFWKNTKGSAVLELGEDMEIADLMKNLDVTTHEQMVEKMNQQLQNFQRGLDQALVLQNMELKNQTVELPIPEWFRRGSIENVSAATGIPVKILIGMQTGERSSTEDAREWAQTCMSRRNDLTHPTLLALINRLERFGVVPEKDWHVHQTDLTEATQAQKVVNASTMADVEQKASRALFTDDEYRRAAGLEPATAEQQAELKKLSQERSDRQERTTEGAPQPDQPGERMNP